MSTEELTRLPWFAAGLRGLGGAGSVLLISRDEVARCLELLDPVAIVREALVEHHAGRTLLPAEAYLRWDNDQGAYTRSIAMPGGIVRDGGPAAYGMKIINASVSNPAAGLERAGGVGLCFDPQTARISAIIEIGLISSVRTAAVSLVGVQAAGHADATCLAVLGCGTQGGTHLFLFADRLPGLRLVALHDADPAAAAALAERARLHRPGIEVAVLPDARAALRDADLVLTATTADDGYLPPDWIRPGAAVVNVSLADLTAEALLQAGRLYVDDVELVEQNPRRPLGRLMQQGLVTAPGSTGGGRPIDATIGALAAGAVHAAPPPSGSYTVINPFGMGVLDVALLDAIRRAATGLGLGTEVTL
ncbi:ornithine cyclodeaminase [Catellatospora sp. NPDC049133]|uniref:ornithine cyclodeaminase n=1 Tax=Catellatospora sp. NPDC049133 TaxID=3155499 RepID=UPI0033DCC2ED